MLHFVCHGAFAEGETVGAAVCSGPTADA